MRDLENLKNHPDIGLGAMVALLFAHKKFANQGSLWFISIIKLIFDQIF